MVATYLNRSKFRVVEDVFQARLPDLIQWVVRFSYGRLYFTDASIIADKGAAMYATRLILAGVLLGMAFKGTLCVSPCVSLSVSRFLSLRRYQGQVQLASMVQSQFGHMGIILRMSGEPFATLSGKVARIAELDEVLCIDSVSVSFSVSLCVRVCATYMLWPVQVMQELEEDLLREQQQQQQHGSSSTARILESSDGVVQFEGVDVVTPRGENVAGKLTVTVTPTTPLMVTGASAAGKSSLVRVMGGLWPMHSGTLTRPRCTEKMKATSSTDDVLSHSQSVSIQSIFLVPQKIREPPLLSHMRAHNSSIRVH